ncbi:MAG: glycosyltransferase [Bacteroidales bacterium]|nr:glycosyltransferase [Bacteroidales bacterium]MDZ4203364.1 glycosyltransferase [Bacteroidales bacterium]
MKKRVVVSVVNDLSTDRRVGRTCQTLVGLGFEVLLVGRKLKHSLPLPGRSYETLRMRLVFNKGPFFYAEFNIRIFLLLFFKRADLLVANDLDTLMPNYIHHRFRKIPLVYDTHEYFTGVPELMHRPQVQKVWKAIEKWIFPKLRHVITVNESIANLYHQEYGVNLQIVRNIPHQVSTGQVLSKKEIGLPENKRIVLLQGAGINIDRGAEEAIDAMQWVEGGILVILGGGDVMGQLRQRVVAKGFADRVFFIPGQPPDLLRSYTCLADIGLTLDKDTNVNYRYSLPNKLFDYIHAGVPILASPLPEVKKIIDQYDIGVFIENHEPQHIATKINAMFADMESMSKWKKNLGVAATELTWENEEKVLNKLFQRYA